VMEGSEPGPVLGLDRRAHGEQHLYGRDPVVPGGPVEGQAAVRIPPDIQGVDFRALGERLPDAERVAGDGGVPQTARASCAWRGEPASRAPAASVTRSCRILFRIRPPIEWEIRAPARMYEARARVVTASGRRRIDRRVQLVYTNR
jgi:hypothetical protein